MRHRPTYDWKTAYRPGMTIKELAEAAGSPYLAAYQAAQRLGLKMKPGKPHRFQTVYDWKAAYRPGMTAADLAKAAGASVNGARRAAQRLGLKLERDPNTGGNRTGKGGGGKGIDWLALWKPGLTAAELARKAGVTRQAAHQAAKKLGLKLAGRRRTTRPEFIEGLRALAEKGMTAAEAAKVVGMKPHTVRDAAKRHGIEFRKGYKRPRPIMPSGLTDQCEKLYREVLVKHWRPGMTAPELARRIGKSEQTGYNILRRADKILTDEDWEKINARIEREDEVVEAVENEII